MPWMNAEVDLIHSDVLAGEMGRAETRWSGLWDDVRSTTAWERWLLGGKMAALRAEIALATEGPEEAAEWAGRAVDMARRVRRAKYEAAARTSLGKALLALGEHEKATEELRTAVAGADGLINPYGRWRARAELATALQASGDDAGAQTQLREAAAIITTVAEGLSQDRSQKFLAAEPVAEILRSL